MENDQSRIQFGSATTVEKKNTAVLLSPFLFDLVVVTVGTVENSRAWRVFHALWERWENLVCFSTAASVRQFPQSRSSAISG
jgi:hypothetical protein